MEDKTIKDALVALATTNTMLWDAYISLSRVIAKRMPSLTPVEREELLTALESDKRKIEQLKAAVLALQE